MLFRLHIFASVMPVMAQCPEKRLVKVVMHMLLCIILVRNRKVHRTAVMSCLAVKLMDCYLSDHASLMS